MTREVSAETSDHNEGVDSGEQVQDSDGGAEDVTKQRAYVGSDRERSMSNEGKQWPIGS